MSRLTHLPQREGEGRGAEGSAGGVESSPTRCPWLERLSKGSCWSGSESGAVEKRGGTRQAHLGGGGGGCVSHEGCVSPTLTLIDASATCSPIPLPDTQSPWMVGCCVPLLEFLVFAFLRTGGGRGQGGGGAMDKRAVASVRLASGLAF